MRWAKENAPKEQLDCIIENRKVTHAAIGYKSVSDIECPQDIGVKANIFGTMTEVVNPYGRVIMHRMT